MERTKFTGKVSADAKKRNEERQERKNRLGQELKERYNQPRLIEFNTKPNMERFIPLPNGFVNLVGLTKAGIAVYPVLCSMADFYSDNWFQLSRANIAKLAGVDLRTVDRGIKELMSIDAMEGSRFCEQEWKTEGMRHFFMYRIRFVRGELMRENHGKYFVFHTCIIENRVWAELTLRAKCLYMAMRSVSFFDAQAYGQIEMGGAEVSEMDFDFNGSAYRNRKWDLCTVPLTNLCAMVRIERTNIREVIRQLQRYGLVEPITAGYFMVYLKPKIREILY